MQTDSVGNTINYLTNKLQCIQALQNHVREKKNSKFHNPEIRSLLQVSIKREKMAVEKKKREHTFTVKFLWDPNKYYLIRHTPRIIVILHLLGDSLPPRKR